VNGLANRPWESRVASRAAAPLGLASRIFSRIDVLPQVLDVGVVTFRLPPHLFTQPHSLLEFPAMVFADAVGCPLVGDRLTLADQRLRVTLAGLETPSAPNSHRSSLE